MQIFDREQATSEWFSHRVGLPTASRFHDVMAKGVSDKPSKVRHAYMMKLVAERMTGVSEETYSNEHMLRGQLLEGEARDLYQFVTGNEVRRIGFIKNNDVGCSPDGLIGDDGILEIKTKLPHLHLDVLVANEVPSEHLAQIQGCLWVSERAWCDFVSYCHVPDGHPDARRLPEFIKRVYRDEEHIQRIANAVKSFNDELHALTVKLIGRYFKE